MLHGSYRDLRRIRRYLPKSVAIIATNALVRSRLDYCNSLCRSLTKKDLNKLQCIQNSLACLVSCSAQLSLASPILKSLHWLPVSGMADNSRGPEDDELSIPRAALNKMIKELVPNVRVANDARELILNCCTEFIHLVSSEANDICNKQHKKTISPEHTLKALESLGFGSYNEDMGEVLREAKAVAAKKRRQSSKLENLGIPEDELLRQQQALFAQARMEQAQLEQQEWARLQQAAQAAQMQQQAAGGNTAQDEDEDGDYD